MLLLVSSLTFVRSSLEVSPFDWRYRKGVLAAAATLGVLLGIRQIEFSRPIIHLVVATFAATVTFLGVLAVQGFDPEDRKLVSRRRSNKNSAT